MEKEFTVEAFIKAVHKDHFDKFLNNGEIYMNPVSKFRLYEAKSEAIGDKYEGASFAICKGATIKVAPLGSTENFITVSKDAFDVLYFDDENAGNILSLYTITDEGNTHYISRKFINEFNNHRFCLITAPQLFLDKLNAEIIKIGLNPIVKMVGYYPSDTQFRKLTPFQKRDKYGYQKETRVFFNNSIEESKTFYIGSMREFAIEIDPCKHVYKLIYDMDKELNIMPEYDSIKYK